MTEHVPQPAAENDTQPVAPDPLDPDLPPDPEVEPLNPNEPLEPLEPELPPEEKPLGYVDEERLTRPAPGGPNDPGASASDENQADTPGYAGGGDDDPPADPADTTLWDEEPDEV